ncbi:S8 family serine peptidase [Arthrobacter sp. I2-34]|uniref:S8 family serine peptidase n=1 Tax=Arthrobacter hankyongi TaxID=2904801 RepID=A0ABS9L1W5_9MICC|nr:S8 family serine peptidase [Arthrobacter hankyongi]MCG2620634.1 S8 family serine peptidase [Arthrobacter hankyongi]
MPSSRSRAERYRAVRAAALACGVILSLVSGLVLAPAAAADEVQDKEYWLDAYGIREAWKTTKGEGVKVAVIDSGVDGSHPDLKGVVVGGADMSGAGKPNGQEGIGATPEHGTLVATLLAGRGHTPEPDKDGAKTDGVLGVAPGAELLAVSTWLGSENPAGVGVDEQIPAAVRWAVDHGAKVINMSLTSSTTSWPQSWDSAFLYAEQKDVVIVAAAGNRAGGTFQSGAPATIPGVLTVAGLDRQGNASRDASSQSIVIGVAAPAEDLVGGLPGGLYAEWSGTSGAAPLVSGVAALIRAKYPQMSAAQVINRIISTSRDAGAAGHDPIYGFGILDAAAALNADVPETTGNPLGSIAQWITVHRRGQPAPAEPSAPATHSTRPPIPEPTTPVAVAPRLEGGVLPAVVVVGFGALILLVAGLGVQQTLRARRQAAAKAGTGTAGGTQREKP